MKANYEHTAGNIFYQWLIVSIITWIVLSLTGCSNAYVSSEQQVIQRHAELFMTDVPEFMIQGDTNNYQLWFSAETDSVQLTIWFVRDWHTVERYPFKMVEETLMPAHINGPTWAVTMPASASQRGLYLLYMTGFAGDITYQHTYKFEVL